MCPVLLIDHLCVIQNFSYLVCRLIGSCLIGGWGTDGWVIGGFVTDGCLTDGFVTDGCLTDDCLTDGCSVSAGDSVCLVPGGIAEMFEPAAGVQSLCLVPSIPCASSAVAVPGALIPCASSAVAVPGAFYLSIYHSLGFSLTQPLAQPLCHSDTQPLSHSATQPLTKLLSHPLTQPLIEHLSATQCTPVRRAGKDL